MANSEHPGARPTIGDYAFLSDCHSVALLSRAGSIDWCCSLGSTLRLSSPESSTTTAAGSAHSPRPNRERARHGATCMTPWCWRPRSARPEARLGSSTALPCAKEERPIPIDSCCASSKETEGAWSCRCAWRPASTTGRSGRGCATGARASGAPWAATTPWSSGRTSSSPATATTTSWLPSRSERGSGRTCR
jgi:hypothetical protein